MPSSGRSYLQLEGKSLSTPPDMMSCRALPLELNSVLGSGSRQLWGFSLLFCLK